MARPIPGDPGRGGAAGPPGRGGLMATLRKKPGLAVGGAAVVGVVGFALYRRSQGGGSAGSGASAAGTAAPGDQYSGAGTGLYDSTATDLYNSLESQIASLQGQIAGITVAQTSPTSSVGGQPSPVPTPKPPVSSGGGLTEHQKHIAHLAHERHIHRK